MNPTYPKRPKDFFANQFIRLLTKKCVANELGPQAFTLLTVIVMTEDARRYSDAVTFYNGQLCPLIGVGSEDALDRVRAKCVAAGWLHYIPGGRRTGPGKYWVTVPQKYAGTDDAPTDEPSDDGTLIRTHAEQTAEQTASKPRSKPRANRGPFLPVPSPVPFAGSPPAPTTDTKHEPRPEPKPKPPEQPGQPQPATKAKQPRERNALFDALAEVTRTDPKAQGAHIGKVATVLNKFSPPATPDEVHEFARRWRELLPWAKPAEHPLLTLGIIEKHFHVLRAAGRSPPAAQPSRNAMLSPEAMRTIHPPEELPCKPHSKPERPRTILTPSGA